MGADVLDVFAAIASPGWRREHPARVAARLAWAGQRLASARVAPLRAVQGVGVGDRVLVWVSPSNCQTGRVQAWEQTPTGAVAFVVLDAAPPVRAPRHRLTPLQEHA